MTVRGSRAVCATALAVTGLLLIGSPALATPSETASPAATEETMPAETTTDTPPSSASTTAGPTTSTASTTVTTTSPGGTTRPETPPPSTTTRTSTGSDAPTTSSSRPTTSAPRQRAALAPLAATDLSVTVGSVGTIVSGATSAGGSLPLVSVTTWQGQAWSASASSTDFTCPGGVTIPRSQVTYRASAVAGLLRGGGSTGSQTLDTQRTVLTSNGSGSNGLVETATWTPLLTVAYPDGASACTYSGTITVSAY